MVFNDDAFRYIELMGDEGVTAETLSIKIGIPVQQAANWLSKWSNRGMLQFIPFNGKVERLPPHKAGRPKGGRGHYTLGKVEWASYRYGKLEDRMAIRDRAAKW